MNVSYILLSRLWLVDNDVLYNDQSNKYHLSHEGKKIKLLSSKSMPKSIELKPNEANELNPNEPNESDNNSMISANGFP